MWLKFVSQITTDTTEDRQRKRDEKKNTEPTFIVNEFIYFLQKSRIVFIQLHKVFTNANEFRFLAQNQIKDRCLQSERDKNKRR